MVLTLLLLITLAFVLVLALNPGIIVTLFQLGATFGIAFLTFTLSQGNTTQKENLLLLSFVAVLVTLLWMWPLAFFVLSTVGLAFMFSRK